MAETVEAPQPTSFAEFNALMDKSSGATVEVEEKPTAEAAAEEIPSAEAVTDSPETDEEIAEETEASEPQDPHVAKRIKKILAQRLETRKENQKLLRQIAELTAKPEKAEPPAAAPAANKDWYADDNPAKPQPKQVDFTTFEAYMDARADWRADRTLEKLKFESAQTEQREAIGREAEEINTAYRERLKASPEATEIQDLVGEGKPKQKLWFPEAVADFIKSSDQGPAILLKLLKDEGLYKEVMASRHPMKQFRAMQKIEASFSKTANPVKLVTSAPKPPTILGGRSTPAGASKPEEARSKEEFNRLMDRKAG